MIKKKLQNSFESVTSISPLTDKIKRLNNT